MRNNRVFLKIISFLLAFLFCIQQSMIAQPVISTVDSVRGHPGEGHRSLFREENIIPDAALLVDKNMTSRGDLVVNIQDLHSSLSAQYSIIDILNELYSKYDIKVVSIEGASGYLDPSILRSWPDKDVRGKTARFLMENGEISAGEFFAITTENEIALYGAEDNELYLRNLEMFRKLYSENNENRELAEYLLSAMEKRIDTMLTKPLADLIRKKKLKEEGKIPFSVYVDYLTDRCRESGIDLSSFESFHVFREAREMEKKVDFQEATSERARFLDELIEALEEESLRTLIAESASFKEGRISQERYHRTLIKKAAEGLIEMEEYPEFSRFVEYLDMYENLDIIALAADLENAEDKLMEAYFSSDNERDFYEALRYARLLRGLFRIELSPEDVSLIEAARQGTPREDLFCFAAENEENRIPPEKEKNFMDAVRRALEFYETAREREKGMFANTVRAMRNEGAKAAALITGGHHSAGLKGIFEEKNLSYLVMMPKCTPNEQRPYVAVLTRKAGPYRELVNSGSYDLAVQALVQSNDISRYDEAVAFAAGQAAIEGKEPREVIERWLRRREEMVLSLEKKSPRRASERQDVITTGDLSRRYGGIRIMRARKDPSPYCEVRIQNLTFAVDSEKAVKISSRSGFPEVLSDPLKSLRDRPGRGAHPFKAVSFYSVFGLGGGLDWAALFVGITAGAGLFLFYGELSLSGSVLLAAAGGYSGLIAWNSINRTLRVLEAISKTRPGKNFRNMLTYDISEDKRAMRMLKKISEHAYGQVHMHESFSSHIAGLAAFLPGMVLIKGLKDLLGRAPPQCNVLLIASPIQEFSQKDAGYKAGYFASPPYGLYRMKRYLERKEHEVKVDVFDPNLHSPWEVLPELKKMISEREYGVIGFSLSHSNMQTELDLIHDLRSFVLSLDPSHPVLFLGGGQEATHNYRQWLTRSSLDAVVLGYGEEVLEQIIDTYGRTGNFDLEGIPGIMRMDEKGKEAGGFNVPVSNRHFRESLFPDDPGEVIPYQEYWNFNARQYDPLNLAMREATLRAIRLYTSSHCLNKCGFCSSWNFLSASTGVDEHIRILPAREIFHIVLQNIRKHAPDAIFFNDDDFLVNRGSKAARDRVLRFCEMIVRAKEEGRIPARLKFYTQTKVRNIVYKDKGEGGYKEDTEILSALHEAGFTLIALGVESFSDRILKSFSIQKGITAEMSDAAISGIKRAGMTPLINIIMFPPEIEKEDLLETIDRAVYWVEKGAQLSVNPVIEYYPGAKISRKIESGEYGVTSREILSPATGERFETPLTVNPSDPEMAAVAAGLMEEREKILEEFRNSPGWGFEYPPQIINGLVLFMSALELLFKLSNEPEEQKDIRKRINKIRDLIFNMLERPSSEANKGILALSARDKLTEKAERIMAADIISMEKTEILVTIADDLQYVRPGQYRRIVDYLTALAEEMLRSGKLSETDREIVEYAGRNLARLEPGSRRIERINALLNFYFGTVSAVLNDYYLSGDEIVDFIPAGDTVWEEGEIAEKFRGEKVLVIEPHHDDAAFFLGNILKEFIVPNSESVSLISVINDPEGVEDSYARKYAVEKLQMKEELDGRQLNDVKKRVRLEEGKAMVERLGGDVFYRSLELTSRVEEPVRDEKGKLLTYQSTFEALSPRAMTELRKAMERQNTTVVIVPLPSAAYHQHHRDVTREALKAVAGYNRQRKERGLEPAALYFYPSAIGVNQFEQFRLRPTLGAYFGEEGRAAKKHLLSSYVSQFRRRREYKDFSEKLDGQSGRYLEEFTPEKGHAGSYAEMLMETEMAPSELAFRKKIGREQQSLFEAVSVLIGKLETTKGPLRIMSLDDNLCYETDEDFGFLPIDPSRRITGENELLKQKHITAFYVKNVEDPYDREGFERMLFSFLDAVVRGDSEKVLEITGQENTYIKAETAGGTRSPAAFNEREERLRKKILKKGGIVVSIHQPGYHRYMGFFHKLGQSDIFVLADERIYEKQEWQNRQRFPGPGKEEEDWMTVPLRKGHDSDLIKDKVISEDIPWRKKHWEWLKRVYSGTDYFDEYGEFFEELYSREWKSLAALNEAMIRYQAKKLNLGHVIIVRASDLGQIQYKRADYIVSVIKKVLGEDLWKLASDPGSGKNITYLSGLGAHEYLYRRADDGRREIDHILEEEHIELVFQSYDPDSLKEKWDVNPYSSATDILFRLGPKAREMVSSSSEGTRVDRSRRELERAAQGVLERLKALEHKRADLTPEEKRDMASYTEYLERIYREIEKRSYYYPGRVSRHTPVIAVVSSDDEIDQEKVFSAIAEGPRRGEVMVLGKNARETAEEMHRRTRERFPEKAFQVKITPLIQEDRPLKTHAHEPFAEEDIRPLYDNDGTVYPDLRAAENEEFARSAFVVMAGGMGTRLASITDLGYEEKARLGISDIRILPDQVFSKATVPFTVVTHKSPLHLILEEIAGLSRDRSSDIPVIIISTSQNRRLIKDLLEENDFFGLDTIIIKEDHPGPPVFGSDGRVLLNQKEILSSGGGTGGSFLALGKDGFDIFLEKGRERVKGRSCIEWLKRNRPGIKDLYFLQTDALYSADMMEGLIRAKNAGRGKDLVVLGYEYPDEKEFKLGVIVNRISEQDKGQKRLEVLEYRDIRGSDRDRLLKDPERGKTVAYAGMFGIDLYKAVSYMKSGGMPPQVHWNKRERMSGGGVALVNKLQYSITELFLCADDFLVVEVPFDSVRPMKDPKKLAEARKFAENRDKALLSGAEISSTSKVEISPLARLEHLGEGIALEDAVSLYIGGSPYYPSSVVIHDNVVFRDGVTVLIEAGGTVEIGDSTVFEGEDTIMLDASSGKDLFVPAGSKMAVSKGRALWKDSRADLDEPAKPAGKKHRRFGALADRLYAFSRRLFDRGLSIKVETALGSFNKDVTKALVSVDDDVYEVMYDPAMSLREESLPFGVAPDLDPLATGTYLSAERYAYEQRAPREAGSVKEPHPAGCKLCRLDEREILEIGGKKEFRVNGRKYIAAVNIRPYFPHHFMMISTRSWPQYLSLAKIKDLLTFQRAIGSEWGGHYNGINAGASQLHFHGQFRKSVSPFWKSLDKGHIVIGEKQRQDGVTSGWARGVPGTLQIFESRDIDALSRVLWANIKVLLANNVPHTMDWTVTRKGKVRVMLDRIKPFDFGRDKKDEEFRLGYGGSVRALYVAISNAETQKLRKTYPQDFYRRFMYFLGRISLSRDEIRSLGMPALWRRVVSAVNYFILRVFGKRLLEEERKIKFETREIYDLVLGIEKKIYLSLGTDFIKEMEDKMEIRILPVRGKDPQTQLRETLEGIKNERTLALFISGDVFSDAGNITEEAEKIFREFVEHAKDNIVIGLLSAEREDLMAELRTAEDPEKRYLDALQDNEYARLRDMDDLRGIAGIAVKNLPEGRSYDLTDKTFRQLRIRQMNLEKSYSAAADIVGRSLAGKIIESSRTEPCYFIHYADGGALISGKGPEVVPVGLEVGRRRQLQGTDKEKDNNYDYLVVMAPEGVDSAEEIRDFRAHINEMWMLEGVIDDDRVIILKKQTDRPAASLVYESVREQQARSAEKGPAITHSNTGIRCLNSNLEYDAEARRTGMFQLNITEGVRTNLNQHDVFIFLMFSPDPDSNVTPPGLEKCDGEGLYTYGFPRPERIIFEETLRRYYELYKDQILKKA